MGNYLKMKLVDKENLCQNIYIEEIVRTAHYLKDYGEYAKIGKKTLPVTCYTNFRDALFHFRKLAECLEEHEIMQQSYAIKEHLSRARTDARISVLTYFSYVVTCLMKKESVEERMKLKLRISLHQMRNTVLISRISGMMMSEIPGRNVDEAEVDEILQVFFDLVEESLFEQFKEVNDDLEFLKIWTQ